MNVELHLFHSNSWAKNSQSSKSASIYTRNKKIDTIEYRGWVFFFDEFLLCYSSRFETQQAHNERLRYTFSYKCKKIFIYKYVLFLTFFC